MKDPPHNGAPAALLPEHPEWFRRPDAGAVARPSGSRRRGRPVRPLILYSHAAASGAVMRESECVRARTRERGKERERERKREREKEEK